MRILEKGMLLADRYVLVRQLGTGGMSDVWLADDRRSGSPVALKILAARLAGNSRYRSMLHAEWQLGLRLMHPNIVRVFEYHDDSEQPFYSLQYLDGPDISIVSQHELVDILRPFGLICDALRYAHGKGVIHRDIKAANILLDSRGIPYLIDFGVAATGLQDAGGGTLIAASPQQLAGHNPDPTDDIFALGGLLYELLSGLCPYGTQPTAEDIKNKTVRPLAEVVKHDVPAALQVLLEEMLDKSAAGRPSAEFIASRLSEMGFPAGAVARRLLPARVSAVKEAVGESVAPIQAARPAPKPELPGKDARHSAGISARTTFIALSVMVVVLLGVVFVLPRTLSTQPAESPDTAVANQAPSAAPGKGAIKENGFSESISARENRPGSKQEADESLGELLSKLERLKLRAVDRWAGQAFRLAQDSYAEGDKAYLDGDYANASARYQETISALDPLLKKVDEVYADTLEQAEMAVLNGQSLDAVRLYELAVAMSPGDQIAIGGLARARNLDSVLALTRQSLEFERDQDLQGARQAIEKALELDPQWQPAIDIAARINAAIVDWTFAERMSEGFNALSLDDFASARAAFMVAQEIKPASTEPRDGLLQVEQNIRLARIASLSREADALIKQERWEEAVIAYKSILDIESNLDLATSGLAAANERVNMHNTLGRYIAEPDSLSEPATLQSATLLLLQIARMRDVGPRLEGQKNELSKLLKRATTELDVQLLSDNATDVAIYKVGKLGSFESRELKLRPGTYVAVGSRPGYRDVRLEFRVAPELDLQPVVVRCEEKI